MSINIGRSYHIKDEFFSLVQDDKLMANKENGKYRPHFFLLSDPHVEGIYWAVPLSSKVEKYRDVAKRKIDKYGRCDTVVIGSFAGEDSVFLIQNMFPVIERYVDHEHTIGGESVNVSRALYESVVSNARHVLSLHKHGRKLIFPDIDRIYELMKNALHKGSYD